MSGNLYDDLIAFAVARLNGDASEAAVPEMLWGETAADNDMDERRDRALREVAAGRAIVARCALLMNELDQWPNGLVSPRAVLARQVMACLASAWSDHPDYQEEWKP
jgi:hypothetical protein